MLERGDLRRLAALLGVAALLLVLASVASAVTGDLSGSGCTSGDTAVSPPCTDSPTATSGGSNSGLDAPQSVDVSPDGADVYVASQGDDAIVHLNRDAATGSITFGDCITAHTATGPSPGGNGACSAAGALGNFNTGMDNPSDVAVSPDGSDVYAVARNDASIVHFSRNTSTGALTYVGCQTMEQLSATGMGGPCTALTGATSDGSDSGLSAPTGIAISPGTGANVYVTASGDDAIARFDRNPGTGALTYVDCLTGETASTLACPFAGVGAANGAASGKDDPYSPVVSADGKNVYMTSGGDAAVAWFNRAAGGGLTWNDCITGETGTGPSGSGGCSTLTPGATVAGNDSGLTTARAVVIAPDDDYVYTGSETDSAVSSFVRAANGDLSLSGCLTGNASIPAVNCAHIASSSVSGENSGLRGVESLAISPDGKSLYAAAISDDALATFDRALSNGALTYDSCITGESASGPAGSAACAAPGATANGTDSGLDNLRSLAVTPDGLELVGVAELDASITYVNRTNAPQTTLGTAPPALSNDNTPTFTFTANESPVTFQCKIDGDAFGACSGASTHTTGALADGQHTFQVRALNDAGSPDLTPAASTFTVDATPPDATISAGPSGAIATSSTQFAFSATGGATELQCRLDGSAFAACTSPKAFTGLSNASHTFEVRALDAAGNVDPTPAARTFTVDTVPPNSSITAGPDGPIATTSAQFAFAGTGGATATQCRLDGGSFAPCTSPKTFTGLKDASHTFEVRALDAAGNIDPSPASRKFSVDTTAPETSLEKKPKKTEKTSKDKKNAKFTFTSNEGGATFECSRDKGKDFKPCTSPYKKKYKRGKHTFEVRAIDAVGNVGSAVSAKWKVKRK
jgi:hypothetical protein